MSHTIENGWMCSNSSNWSRRVRSSTGQTYMVSFGRVDNPEDRGVEHDYTCTCPDFQLRKRKHERTYCKHIDATKEERCTWHTQFTGPPEPVMENGEPKCPHCQAEAIPIRFLT